MKTIADPLYGSIQIGKFEERVISSKVYQRLHNVRQLGQAYLIFPGANYSRFSHSVGALRNAGKLLNALSKNSQGDLKEEIEAATDKYRMAALLHDIGHFPFSHATESAFRSIEADMLGSDYSGERYELVTCHETFGDLIIQNNDELRRIIDSAGLCPKEVSNVFSGAHVEESTLINLKPIISSELDCDRLDYLRRTSHFTGLPYGNVDVDYLISSAHFVDGKICFDVKSKRSADHMLLARFHDYLQVVFHKTLVALEWSLVEAIKTCVKAGTLDASKETLLRKIQNGKISDFDDSEVINYIKQASVHHNDFNDPVKYHMDAVLRRKAAKQCFFSQRYISCSSELGHADILRKVNEVVTKLCAEKGIDPQFVKVWDKEHKLSKAEPGEICHNNDLGFIENSEELIYLNGHSSEPAPLIFCPDSISGILARRFLSDIRVFLLPKEDVLYFRTEFESSISEGLQEIFETLDNAHTVIDSTPS